MKYYDYKKKRMQKRELYARDIRAVARDVSEDDWSGSFVRELYSSAGDYVEWHTGSIDSWYN